MVLTFIFSAVSVKCTITFLFSSLCLLTDFLAITFYLSLQTKEMQSVNLYTAFMQSYPQTTSYN